MTMSTHKQEDRRHADALPVSSALPPAAFDDIDGLDLEPRPFHWPSRRRVLTVIAVLVVLLLLAVLPPLVNVNRYRRQIASSISASLGRPVHLDSVTLTMLPVPGFTLQNFVVTEDPAFGAEPVIRANTVQVRLRVSSLWRRRVEFSRISLEEPSVNLVHRADGKWNLESILLSASRMAAAPTAQKGAGDAPRFPYIEATGARVNLKMGAAKMPLSLTEARFSLWLPVPNEWHLRLEAKPTRTDTAAMDTGLVRLEGTLGKAGALQDVPLNLQGQWTAAPLGAVSWVLLGQDAGLRGELNLTAGVKGTVGDNAMQSRLQLKALRRTEFVPAQTLNADVTCSALAGAVFHRLRAVHCTWPAQTAGSGLTLDAELPNVFQPGSAQGTATLQDVPVATLLDTLHVASRRVSPELQASGMLGGQLSCCNGSSSLAGSIGRIDVTHARVAVAEAAPVIDGPLTGSLAAGEMTGAIPLQLGGAYPALLNLNVGPAGYTMHLTGKALRSHVLQLAHALPQFGDELEATLPPAVTGEGDVPLTLDLTATHPWTGGQSWAAIAPVHLPLPKKRLHR